MSAFSEYDKYLFHEGTHQELYRIFGAHKAVENGNRGIRFQLWAPNASAIELLCSFLDWEQKPLDMQKSDSGIWFLFLQTDRDCFSYRYRITGSDGIVRYKSDPFSFRYERRPDNASVYTEIPDFCWSDRKWQENGKKPIQQQAVSIYEVHPGSWKCRINAETDEREFLNYRDYGIQLTEYCRYMGYTHIELMGICEHPFDGSWGYQVGGYFAPTSRYGIPEDFMWMIDHFHANGIGVILDWVPGHFVKDSYSLGSFDGTHLYESSDPLKQSLPEWGTYAFDLEKPEIQSYLLSSACFWLKEYHVDGLRIDAVASMLYLDYGRTQWRPNRFGGNENPAGFEFLCKLNRMVHEKGRFTAAEDSSILPGITASETDSGLGFDFKWNMGWMHDTLSYMEVDPLFRNYHREQMKASLQYSWLEHYILVLSHDEVVHLKKSMLGKMPGRFEDKTGNLKAYYTWMFLHPGKKLLFMGQDFGQDREWDENREIDWFHASDPGHRELMTTVRELNRIYRDTDFLQKYDCDPDSFQWNEMPENPDVLSFLRFAPSQKENGCVLAVNFSGTVQYDVKIGVPERGSWFRIFSTYDCTPGQYGPSGTGAYPELLSFDDPGSGKAAVSYSLRPFEAVILRQMK